MAKITSFFVLFLLLFQGCARVQTLNMESHRYSERPKNVVWIQVPGLSMELIALLKLANKDASERSNLERSQCVGKFWNYNLFEMQPDAKRGTLSQINGSKNIKGTCDDFIQKPVWRYFREMGYKVAVFEQINSLDESVLRARACGNNESYVDDEDLFLIMSQQKFLNEGEFHRLEKNWPLNGISFDKACLSGACASTLEANVADFFQDWAKFGQNQFLLVRTFQLEKAIKEKDLAKIKEALSELNRLVGYFSQRISMNSLLLVTGAGAIDVQYPNTQKNWLEFEKSGKNFTFNSSSLFATSFAYGAMAENFCGVYGESEVLKRILYTPPNKRFDWDYLLPF